MQLNPYLFFDGHCQAAFNFYAQCFGGQVVAMMTHGESPEPGQVPAEWRGKIMHAQVDFGSQTLMGSDGHPGYREEMKGFAVTLNVDRVAEAERLFAALAENGRVNMPLQQTFWAQRFGMLVDRFGTPWMINCVTPPA